MLRKTPTTWSAAVDRSSVAANLELSTNTAVMAIGGFTGDDPVPTLTQFQAYVRDHKVTYYLAQNNDPTGARKSGPGGWWPGGHKDIVDWVAAHYQAKRVGPMTVYDLSAGPGPAQ
jgi:hypothetical protein